MFFLVVLGVFLSAQLLGLLIWWRRLAGRPRLRLAVAGLFFLANLPWLYLPFASDQPHLPPAWATVLILRPFATWQAGLWLWLAAAGSLSLLVLVLYRLPRFLARAIRQPAPERLANPGRRVFLARTARAAAWGGALATAGWGLVRVGIRPRVVTLDLAFPDLPPALDGLKIAHLSDLHLGLWSTPGEIAQALDLTRSLDPDLVVITGDLIDHNPALAQVFLRHLPLLRRVPLGLYGIIGNHDLYTGAEEVTAAVQSGGVVMLRNRHQTLTAQGLPLALIGVDDPGRHWYRNGGPVRLGQALRGLPAGLFPILLSHRPGGFDQARARGLPLTLCGHTHGGQFALPGGPNLADLTFRYTHGLYREPEGLLYVSAGLGAVGLPFRLGVPPEIALLRLKRA